MAEIYQRLGAQQATTATNVVDNGATANTWTIISSLVICNTGSSSYTYTISTSNVSGSHNAYIASGATIAANDTIVLVAGICLDPTYRYLVAHASNANVYITAYGVKGP